MPDKETTAPLFRFSRHLSRDALLALTFAAVYTILRLEQARLGQIAITLVGWLFFISILQGLYLLRFFHSIRDGWFYEDHFTIKGWRTNRRIDYGSLEAVTQAKATQIGSGPLESRIFVRGAPKPLVIPGVPKNKELETDLYSWLSAKVQSLHRASLPPTDSREAELSSSEGILCIVSSSSLRRHGESYTLVVTRTQIIGSSESTWAAGYSVYLGPGSQATEAEREEAHRITQEVMKTSDMQLHKDSMLQVSYKASGTVSVGYLIFRTVDGDIELALAPFASDMGFREVLSCLLRAVNEFAPGVIRDEKSGALLTTLDL